MFLTRKMIGLDIGSSAVRIVELEKQQQQITIKKLGIVPLPMGVISNGIIHNEEIVSRAITQAVKESGTNVSNVILSIDGQQTHIRLKTFPVMKKKDLVVALRKEAESLLPISPFDIIMDYQIVREYTREGIGLMDVILAVCPMQAVEAYIKVARSAGLKPWAVDLQPLAIARLLTNDSHCSDDEIQSFVTGNTLLIDLGADATRLSFFQKGNLGYYFIISKGSHNLTKTIANKCRISLDEAEAIKKNHVLIDKDVRLDILKPEIAGKFDLKAFQEAALGLHKDEECQNETEKLDLTLEVSEFLGEIIKEVRSAVETYRSCCPSEIINQVLLTGGGAKLPGLADLLVETLDIKVNLFNPLNYTIALNPSDIIADNAIRLAHSIGLALREVK